jgi:hypothetical protein
VGGATAGAGSTTTEAGTPYSEGPASLGEGTIPPDAGSSSPEKALEAYARLRTADQLVVQVNRRGSNTNLDYNIK